MLMLSRNPKNCRLFISLFSVICFVLSFLPGAQSTGIKVQYDGYKEYPAILRSIIRITKNKKILEYNDTLVSHENNNNQMEEMKYMLSIPSVQGMPFYVDVAPKYYALGYDVGVGVMYRYDLDEGKDQGEYEYQGEHGQYGRQNMRIQLKNSRQYNHQQTPKIKTQSKTIPQQFQCSFPQKIHSILTPPNPIPSIYLVFQNRTSLSIISPSCSQTDISLNLPNPNPQFIGLHSLSPTQFAVVVPDGISVYGYGDEDGDGDGGMPVLIDRIGLAMPIYGAYAINCSYNQQKPSPSYNITISSSPSSSSSSSSTQNNTILKLYQIYQWQNNKLKHIIWDHFIMYGDANANANLNSNSNSNSNSNVDFDADTVNVIYKKNNSNNTVECFVYNYSINTTTRVNDHVGPIGTVLYNNPNINIVVNTKGTVYTYNNITKNLQQIYQIPIPSPPSSPSSASPNPSPSLTSILFTDNTTKTVYFTTTDKIMGKYQYQSQSQSQSQSQKQTDQYKYKELKTGVDFIVMGNSIWDYSRSVTNRFVVACQFRSDGDIGTFCLFSRFDYKDQFVDQATVKIGTQRLMLISFVQDQNQTSSLSYYYLVFKTEQNTNKVVSLVRSASQLSWSQSSPPFQTPYPFTYTRQYIQRLGQRTLLVYYNQSSVFSFSGRTGYTQQYHTPNLQKIISTNTNNYKIIFVYANGEIEVRIDMKVDGRDVVPQLGVGDVGGCGFVGGSLVYCQGQGGNGRIFGVASAQMRLPRWPEKIDAQLCQYVQNVRVFRYRNHGYYDSQYTIISTPTNDPSPTKMLILSRLNSSQNATARTLTTQLSYNKTRKLQIKKIDYNSQNNQIYIILYQNKEGVYKQYLLYQSLTNYIFDGMLTWRGRFAHNNGNGNGNGNSNGNWKIMGYASTMQSIGIAYAGDGDGEGMEVVRRVKSLGRVKVPRIYLSHHMARNSPYCVLCDRTSGTQVLIKCYKKNFLTNQTLSTISDPDYALDYTSGVQMSPLGKFVLIQKSLFLTSEQQSLRIGTFPQSSSSTYRYFLTDNIILQTNTYYMSQKSYTNLTLLYIKQNPFNFTIKTFTYSSVNKTFLRWNLSHIFYYANRSIYTINLQLQPVMNFSIDAEVGYDPELLYVTDFGEYYVGWNTLLYKWVTVEKGDDEDGGGGHVGAIVGIVVGVAVVAGVGVAAVWYFVKRRRLRMQKSTLLGDESESHAE